MNAEQAELIPTRPGARLQAARRAKGLSVAELATKLHLRERIIRALESDDTDWIAPVYLRGYIKSYATELGLNPAELEAEARATAGEDPELRSVFNIDPRRGFAERWLKSGSYLVATALIAALVWQVTQQAVEFSQGGTSVVGIEKSDPSSDTPSPATSQQSTHTGQGTHLAASIASLEKLRTPSIDPGAAAEQAWSAISTPPAAGNPLINITVSADSWVEIVDGTGEMIEKDLLRGGNQRSYEGQPPFQLLLGRPSAVVLEFKGELVDLEPHVRGDVARLTLGEEDPAPTE